jgi:hypothetical protein
MVHAKKEGRGVNRSAPLKRSERRLNFLKLISRCP